MDNITTTELGGYSSTVGEVYTRFAIHHIHSGHTSSILDQAGFHRRSLGDAIPSWVLDWTGQVTNNCPRKSISGLRNVPFAASKDTQAIVRVSDESTNAPKLVIRGQMVDTLSAVLLKPLETDDSMDAKDFLLWYSQMRTLLTNMHELCSTVYTDV